jgi:hypothetical protein
VTLKPAKKTAERTAGARTAKTLLKRPNAALSRCLASPLHHHDPFFPVVGS